MRLRALFVAAVGVAAFIATATAQTVSASDLYQEALRYQDSKGDLVKAIEIYKTLIDRYPTDPVAPKALLELAACYERTGRPEATATYERVVRDYGSSPAAVAARERLSGSNQKDALAAPKLVISDFVDHVSPDGKYLSFTDWDTGDLAIRELPSGRVHHVTSNGKWNDSFAEEPVFSPDSRAILYDWYDAKGSKYDVRVISRNGGQPRVVFPNDDKDANFTPIGWTTDGQQVLFAFRHAPADRTPRVSVTDVMMVPLSGGVLRLVKRLDGATSFSFSVSPTAGFIAFDLPAEGKPERDIFILSLADGSMWPLAPHIANDRMLDWFPSGDRLLFLSDRAGAPGVWSVAVANGRAQGQPASMRPDTGIIDRKGFTNRGDYYYGLTTREATIQIATIDTSTGKQTGMTARLEGRYQSGQTQAAWSSTGDKIAYVQATKFGANLPAGGRAGGGQTDKRLAIQTIATGDVRLLNLPMTNMQNPVWMPGDDAILLQGNAQDGQGLYQVELATGTLKPLAVRPTSSQASEPGRQQPSISVDGRTMFFMTSGPATVAPGSPSLIARGIDSSIERIVVPSGVGAYALSPDSRWIAVRPRAASDGRILVYPSTGGDPKTLLAGSDPEPLAPLAWSRDGRSIFHFRRVADRRELWSAPVDGGVPTDTGIRIPTGPLGRINVRPDGRSIAISSEALSNATWVMPGVGAKK